VDRHTRANADALQKALEAIPEVVSCHMVSGAPDFIAEIVVPDLAAYEALLTNVLLELPMVEDIKSNFSMRAVKTDGPLPLSPD
jgi:Transcriptional regulators